MDRVRKELENPVVAGITGLVIGLILGIVYAWLISPVEWTDASADLLRDDLKRDYLRMAIDSFSINLDNVAAKRRWEDLGETAPQVMEELQESPGTLNSAIIAAFSSAAEQEVVTEEVEDEPEEGSGSKLLLIMCSLTVLLAAGLVAFYFFRKNQVSLPGFKSAEVSDHYDPGGGVKDENIPPMSQFMTTYMSGDDLFDDSFSIDSPSGEFLGECGVGISEAIGVGEPKKVAAFEVWLFDKNDIQTVTKVLMSEHAFSDMDLRQRLAAKGEPFMASAGSELILETATLQLVARVVDISFGNGALPANSFFDRMTLELAVWQKS